MNPMTISEMLVLYSTFMYLPLDVHYLYDTSTTHEYIHTRRINLEQPEGGSMM